MRKSRLLRTRTTTKYQRATHILIVQQHAPRHARTPNYPPQPSDTPSLTPRTKQSNSASTVLRLLFYMLYHIDSIIVVVAVRPVHFSLFFLLKNGSFLFSILSLFAVTAVDGVQTILQSRTSYAYSASFDVPRSMVYIFLHDSLITPNNPSSPWKRNTRHVLACHFRCFHDINNSITYILVQHGPYCLLPQNGLLANFD